jgi:hypothetical protein
MSDWPMLSDKADNNPDVAVPQFVTNAPLKLAGRPCANAVARFMSSRIWRAGGLPAKILRSIVDRSAGPPICIQEN